MLPKKFAVNPALLGVACLLGALLLIWFSSKEGVAGLLGIGGRDGNFVLVKTKVRDREDAVGREQRSLAEEYMAKAELGMTVDEVRWVVGDFLELGLDVEYPEDTTAEGYLALRKAREEWYLGALVSGLRLTTEQEREARERMAVLRQEDYAEFVEYLDGVKSFEHEGRKMKVFDGSKARKLMDTRWWLMDEGGYAPWELCTLEESQRAISWDGSSESELPSPAVGEALGIRVLENGMLDPFFANLFPFTESQTQKLNNVANDDGDKLSIWTSFHPDQLKMFLLTDTVVSGGLRKALEAEEMGDTEGP